MPYHTSNRSPRFGGALLLVAMSGPLLAILFCRGGNEGSACPRSFAQTHLAALLLWDNAGGTMGAAPEVMSAHPNDLRALADSTDAESCRRLRAQLPDTLQAGLFAPNFYAFYQVGEIYIVPIVPNLKPSEIEAMDRGDFSNERTGTTYVFDREYRLLATYPN